MLKRLIYAAVGVAGLALIGLAIASATLWRADDVLRASATADQAIVVTDPGVLEMAGDPVTVTATVPDGGHVVLAIGRDTDVDGWVGTDAHQRVSGLASWHALALAASEPGSAPTGEGPTPSPDEAATASASASPDAAATASASASSVPDAEASDMWVARAAGEGSAELTWQAQPGRWSLLAVGTAADGGAAPPTLELAWPRTVTTPYLVPGTVVGALLALLALLLLGRDVRRSHRGPAEWTPVLTEPVPVLTATGAQQVLTRRQLREMRVLAEAGHRVELPAGPDESAAVTGQVPAVPSAAGTDAPPAAATAAVPRRHDEVPEAVHDDAAHDDAAQDDAARDDAARDGSGEPTGDTADEAATPPSADRPAPLLGRRSLRRRQATADAETSSDAETTASVPPVPDAPAATSPAPAASGGRPAAADPSAPGSSTPAGTARPAWAPVRRTAAESTPSTPAGPDASSADEPAHEPAWLRTATGAVRRRDARERQTPAWAAADADGPTEWSKAPDSWRSPQRAAAPRPTAAGPAPSGPSPSPLPATSPAGAALAAPPVRGRPRPDPGPGRASAERSVDQPAEQSEASRADAWRRAWGLPSLDAEEDEK